jgi:hypothetical protein
MPNFDTTSCLPKTFCASSSRLRLVSCAYITVLAIEAWPIQWGKRCDIAAPFEFARVAEQKGQIQRFTR